MWQKSIRLKSLAAGAFTLVEIMVVVGILGLLLALTIPYYVQQRATAQSKSCINNLLKIDDAASQFALEHGKRTDDAIDFPADLTPYLRLNSTSEIPACPAGGGYTINLVGSHPICSLGSSVDPAHVQP